MLRIHEPFHGAVLNHRHGVQDEEGLTVAVVGEAPLERRVLVNRVEAEREGQRFEAVITLTELEQDITAVCDGTLGRLEHTVRVVWDRDSRKRYRFSIDDNSFWLRDVATERYDSLFDCFYMRMLKDFNDRYGAKFVLNIYYETDDGWQLHSFPEDYRGEFEDNADWLALSCHAYANLPNRPYQYASPQKLISDIETVEEQIRRFAGEQTLSAPTVIHWGMVLPQALPALAEHGVRVLSGSFRRSSFGHDVHYWQDDDRCEWIARNEALKDFETGLVFSNIDLCGNRVPLDEIEPQLEEIAADFRRAEIMDLFTHEQYFWPFYSNYLPDHADRLDTMIHWVTENGYEPVLFHEGFLGI